MERKKPVSERLKDIVNDETINASIDRAHAILEEERKAERLELFAIMGDLMVKMPLLLSNRRDPEMETALSLSRIVVYALSVVGVDRS